MSRTLHPRRDEQLHRQSASVRLTKIKNDYFYFQPKGAFDGNRWGGTISHVGGRARRKEQRARALEKKLGRRKDRRRQNAALWRIVS